MNGEGQWLLLAATKTPTNHALDTKRRMWRLQMDATMPSLGQLGRSLDEGLIRTQADCFVQNSGRLRGRGFVPRMDADSRG